MPDSSGAAMQNIHQLLLLDLLLAARGFSSLTLWCRQSSLQHRRCPELGIMGIVRRKKNVAFSVRLLLGRSLTGPKSHDWPIECGGPTESHHVHRYTHQLIEISKGKREWSQLTQHTEGGETEVEGGGGGGVKCLYNTGQARHSDATVHHSGYGLIWRQRQRNTPHMNKHWPNKEHRVF